jgi:hypothetical protein
MFVKTTTAEGAPVFAVFEGREFQLSTAGAFDFVFLWRE